MAVSQFITFNIAANLVGINIKDVREINRVLDITPVQHAPEYVKGLVNLRGNTVTVFDLGNRLGLERLKVTDESHNIILKKDAVGLLVDNIGDVIEAEEDDIESPPANMGGIDSRFVEGVLKLENELLLILSADNLLKYEPAQIEEEKEG